MTRVLPQAAPRGWITPSGTVLLEQADGALSTVDGSGSEGLVAAPLAAEVRAALAGAREVVALWDTRHASDPRPREALTATEEWLRHRTSERAKQAHAAADACYLILGELEEPTAGAPGPPWPERWATAFRETRAAGLAALSAAHVGDMSFRYAKLSLTASRERLALAEVPGGPGGAALFSRAAQVDRLGHLPELDTESSARLLRARIAAELLPRALAE